MKEITLACDNIEATAATQVRTMLHKDIITSYQEDLENGAIFPALVVFAEKGSERYILADGFHRLYAMVNAGREFVEVEVHDGGLHDALVYALGANTGHGLRRTNADKVNAVKLALKDPELSQLTQREIADVCRVDRQTVRRVGQRDTGGDVSKTPKNEGGEAEDNKPENNRPTKPEPTQAEIERDELRQSLSLIKAFPYGGEDATKLHLEPDDIDDLEYVSGWCAHAVLVHRKEWKND
jgi:hypothetical protein